MSALLEVANGAVAYGNVEAVRSVSLEVRQSEIVTIIGANGAGKTTLLNAIMGINAYKGALTLDGRDLTKLGIEDRVSRGLCLVPEHRELFGSMPVEDNLLLGGFRNKASVSAEIIERVYTLFPRLKERRQQYARTLSGGEQQMLAIGRGLMSHPRYLLLDEPSLGLAPLLIAEIFRKLAEIRAGGTAILLVEQNASAALDVADYGYVLETGVVQLEGSAASLSADEAVRETYLR
jgi:branched-chain amino acid transport system ATP-binding protein